MKHEKVSQLLKRRSFGGIFVKNLLLLTCLIMVPMLLVVFITTLSMRTFSEKETSLYSSRTISLLQSSTDRMVGDCLQQANYLLAEMTYTCSLSPPPTATPFTTTT